MQAESIEGLRGSDDTGTVAPYHWSHHSIDETNVMPTLRILTNVQIPADQRNGVLVGASRMLADMIGKPESYVMVMLEDGRDMLFAGTSAPAAFLEVKSLGLPENKTPEYSRTLCDFIVAAVGVPAERIYIEFATPPRHLFGWNGGTF
jgi:phenylpyruvate tautomerase